MNGVKVLFCCFFAVTNLVHFQPTLAADWIGSSSCASSTCHGGTVDRGPAWNHSYSVSRSADPHATSGVLLYDIDSQRIVFALSPALDPKTTSRADYDNVLRKRCISCHLTASPADIASDQRLDPQRIGEGVSCESCHGPASEWREPHVLKSWSGLSRFDPTTGMLDTESMVGRAKGCVRCHVGSRTDDGIVRDMNHDLIAAGHPALRFDLLIYNLNMPHHWDDNSDVEQSFNASATKIRNVGRSVSLAAAAKLSSERAGTSLAAKPDEATVPWPELSDFDCFACHQTLLPRAYRLPVNVDGKPKLEVSSGLPLWNSWYTALDTTLGDNQFWRFRPKPGGQPEWITAADKIAELYDAKASQDAAAAARPPLDRFNEIKNDLNRKVPSDWHAAAIIYLEMDAAARDLAAMPGKRSLGEQASRTLHENVAPLLLFDATHSTEDLRLRSPRDFDPRVFRTNTLNALNSIGQGQP